MANRQVLVSIFINYTLEVFEWSTATSGITIALVGVTVAFTAPYFCARYTEACLYYFGLLIQCCAYIMLSVAGTGVGSKIAMSIGVPGIFLISIGGFFISTMQALITSQYAKDRQGECSGVISQLSLVTTIPSYGIALLFSYTLSSDALFYWPGISYAMVRFPCPVNFYYNLIRIIMFNSSCTLPIAVCFVSLYWDYHLRENTWIFCDFVGSKEIKYQWR